MRRALRDAFGQHRVCFDDDGATAPSLRALLAQHPHTDRDVDVVALRAWLDDAEDPTRTPLRAVHQLPPGTALEVVDDGALAVRAVPLPVGHATDTDLEQLLRRAVERAVDGATGGVAVALSGGLDSALVLALARDVVGVDVPAFVLAPRWGGYSERETALRTAEALHHDHVVVVDVDEADFRAALPDAVAAMEVPIWNAHPVGRFLLARALAAAGITRVLSGDGADHVVRRDRTANYLPLVDAACVAHGVALHTPFLDGDVIAALVSRPPDPEKAALREIGKRLCAPTPLVTGPKVSRLAPRLDVDGLVSEPERARLSVLLDRAAPGVEEERAHLRFTTTALLLRSFQLL